MIDLLQIFKDAPFAMYTCDKDGVITFYNKAAVELWGRAPEPEKTRWCGSWKIYAADGTPLAFDRSPMALTIKEGLDKDNTHILTQRPDGSFRNLKVLPRPIFDEQGNLTGGHCTLIDITDSLGQGTQDAILSAIVESSNDAIISKDLNGIIRSWNESAEHIFGYTEAEAVGQSILMLIPPSKQHEEDLIISNIKNGKRIDHFETIRLGKHGREIAISLTISPIKNKEGVIVGASKIARDITEQVRSQRLIKKYTENLEALSEIAKGISEKLDVEIILQRVTDATTKITGAAFGAFFYNTINEQGEAFMLYTLSGAPRSAFEHMGMPRNTAIFNPTFSGQGITRVDDITKDPRYGHNAPYHGMPKGHLPVVSYLSIPVISNSGAVIGGLFFGHPEAGIFTEDHEDIISSIASQAAIAIDNSKLFEEVKSLSAKKDEFIALASHELKTPLTSVKGYLQLLCKMQNNEMQQRFLNKSLQQVERLNALVEDMLNMSKIEAGKLVFNIETFDLRELVLDVTEAFSYTDASHLIIKDILKTPVFIDADRQRIEQVLINLIGNAIKYSPKAKEIIVKLHTDGKSVTFSVQDFGIGLTAEQQQKVFTRFYRAEGNNGISGLGLGLYLTKQIIDRHAGNLQVDSEYGSGSEFHFTLPIRKPEHQSGEPRTVAMS